MRQHMTSFLISAFVLLVSTGLLAIGCNQKQEATAQPGRGGGGRGGGTIPVEALVVQTQPLQNTITTTGTLMANEEVELRPEISGRVTGVSFEEGSRVQKGTQLLKINDRDLQAELKRKEFEEKLAADEEARAKGLLDIQGISQEEYDRVLNKLRVVQAEKEVIQSDIEKTEIIAPFDGVVGLRYISEGGYVTPAMLAATMQDIDPMKVEFSVPEKYAAALRDGTRVQVRVGENQQEYMGNVYAVEAKIDPGTRTIKARARIPNPDGRLLPGAFARVALTVEDIPSAIVIPTSAVIPQLAGEQVFVFRDGKAQSVTVKTGIRTEHDIQITEGLSPNDTLIVTGLLQLSNGRGVEIQQFITQAN